MIYAVAYLAILLPFGLLDAVWLSLMGPRLYQPTLGDILLANVNVPAAVVFLPDLSDRHSGLCHPARPESRLGRAGADLCRAVRRPWPMPPTI